MNWIVLLLHIIIVSEMPLHPADITIVTLEIPIH